MNYTHVEVLKDMPAAKAGTRLIQADVKCMYMYDGCYLPLSFFEKYPEWFCLIPATPEFVVGGYAKIGKDFLGHKAGDIGIIRNIVRCLLHIEVSGRQSQSGIAPLVAHSKDWCSVATPEEYEEQEASKRPWKPKADEYFWFVSHSDSILRTVNKELGSDNKKVSLGNCFRTEEAAAYFHDYYWLPAFEKYAEDYAAKRVPTDKL